MNYLSLTFLFVFFGGWSPVFGQSNAPQTTVEDTTKRHSHSSSDEIIDFIARRTSFSRW
jgi:hypothetical protein